MTNTRRPRIIQGLARALRLYLLLLGLSGALAVGAFLLVHREPPIIPPRDPLARAPYPAFAPQGASPVLCLVSEAARARGAAAGAFEQLDAGRWWVNLAGVLGPIRLEDVEALRWPPPPGVQVVIVTAAAGPTMEARTAELEAWAREGRILVIERPRGKLLELAGARSTGVGVRKTAQVVTVSGLRARLPIELEPVAVGADSRVVMQAWGDTAGGAGRESPSVGTSPGASGDPASGTPVAWLRGLEKGGVLGIAGDLAGACMRRIQGTPRADFTFVPPSRTGALAGIPVPSDMAGESPGQELEPTLDVLAGELWGWVSSIAPVPGWWDIPGGASGAYMCSHDEEAFGDRSAFMAEEEGRRGVEATWFIMPAPMTGEGMAALQRNGAEVALHWHRGFGGGNTRERSFGPFVWQRRALELSEQQRTVSALASAPLAPLTRTHGLQWDADFDSSFRKMVAAGLELDSSYGPYGEQSPWRFGSVRPFRPLDREGRVLPMLELPFVLQDDEAPPLKAIREVIDVGAARRLPIVPIFHVNTMAYKPSVGPIEAWLEGFERAAAKGMWVGTMGGYLRFLKSRQSSSIEGGAWDGRVWNGRVTVVDGGPVDGGPAKGDRAKGDRAHGGPVEGSLAHGGPVEGSPAKESPVAQRSVAGPGGDAGNRGAEDRHSGGQWLRLPQASGGARLVAISLNGRAPERVKCLEDLALIPVPAGSHSLTLSYGAGTAVCDAERFVAVHGLEHRSAGLEHGSAGSDATRP